jgi:hypothetical protein
MSYLNSIADVMLLLSRNALSFCRLICSRNTSTRSHMFSNSLSKLTNILIDAICKGDHQGRIVFKWPTACELQVVLKKKHLKPTV